MKFWIIHASTESCDHHYFLIESEDKPLKRNVDGFLVEKLPSEYECVGHVNWEMEEVVPEKL